MNTKLKLIPALKTLGVMIGVPVIVISIIVVIHLYWPIIICLFLLMLVGIIFLGIYREFDPEFDNWCKDNIDDNTPYC